jgi:cold shock CspA family protein
MPEPQPAQTNIDAKADECELATVIFWNWRGGFARADRGGPDVYLGPAEIARAGIERLEAGARICFEVRKDRQGRKPWATNIRLAEAAA